MNNVVDNLTKMDKNTLESIKGGLSPEKEPSLTLNEQKQSQTGAGRGRSREPKNSSATKKLKVGKDYFQLAEPHQKMAEEKKASPAIGVTNEDRDSGSKKNRKTSESFKEMFENNTATLHLGKYHSMFQAETMSSAKRLYSPQVNNRFAPALANQSVKKD